ncbi:MAG TPA: hypothetical protein VGX94_14075 [Terriglobia bacterium]|nr:hypothetical protein [Terriglobia bacterium]
MSREKIKNFETVPKRRQKPIAVRLEEPIRSAIQKMAEAEDRSAANMIERIVKEYLRSKGMLDCDSDRKESPRKMLMTEAPNRMRESH